MNTSAAGNVAVMSAVGAVMSAAAGTMSAAGNSPMQWVTRLDDTMVEKYVNQNQLAMNNLETLQGKLYNAINGIVDLSSNFEKNIDWISKLLSAKEDDILLGNGDVVPNIIKTYRKLNDDITNFKTTLEGRVGESIRSSEQKIDAEIKRLSMLVQEFITRLESKDTYTKTELDVWLKRIESQHQSKMDEVSEVLEELKDIKNDTASVGIPIATPRIVAPTNGASEQSGIIEASAFSAGESYVFESYTLVAEVDDNDQFTHPKVAKITNNHQIYIELEPNMRYYARVKYVAAVYQSAFSEVVQFNTAADLRKPENTPTQPTPTAGIVPPTITAQKALVLTCSPYQVFYGTGNKDNLPSFEMAKLQSFGADGELNYTREFGTDVVGFTPTTSTLSNMTGAAANTDNISAVGFATPENAFKNDVTTSSEVSSDKGSISYTYAAPQFLREVQVFAPRGSAPLSFKLWGQTDSGKNLLLHKTNVTYTDGASAKFVVEDSTNAYNTFIFEVVESESTRLCLIHKLCYYTQAAPTISIDLTNAQIPAGTYPMRVGFRSANGGYVFGAKQEITLASSSDDYVGTLFREDLNMVRSLGTSYDKDWRLMSTSAAMNTAQTPEYLELSSKEVFKNIYPCVIDVAQDTIVKMPNATEAELTAELAKSAKNSLMVHFPKVYVIYGNLVCNNKTFEIIIIDTKPFSVTFTPDMLFMGEKSNAAITFSTLLNPSALGLQPLGKVVSGNNSAKVTIQGCLHPAFYGQSKICDEFWLSAWWVTAQAVCKPMSHAAATREQWNANIAAAIGQNFGAMRLWTFWDWHLISLLKRAGAQRQNGGRNGGAESCKAYNLRGHPSDWNLQNGVDSFFGMFNIHITTYPTLIDGVFLTESSRSINESYLPANLTGYNDCLQGSVVYAGSAVNVGYIDSASVNAPTAEFKNLGTNIKPLFNTAKDVRATSFRSKQSVTSNTAGYGLTEKNRLLALKMTNASIGIVNGCYGLFHPYAANTSFYARTRFNHLRNRSGDDVLF